jgi:hypothetical protein
VEDGGWLGSVLILEFEIRLGFGLWDLRIVWDLGFGIWDFRSGGGIWDLLSAIR